MSITLQSFTALSRQSYHIFEPNHMTKIAITNVHLDLGAGRRGTDMGPSTIHVAQLISV